MSNLVAIVYPDVETARTVADELGDLIKEESIELEDKESELQAALGGQGAAV